MRGSETVDRFLNRLEGVRSDGAGWSARCPCRQDDENPSLHVGEGRDGRVLVTCHRGSGCSLEEICEAMEISLGDLFPPKEEKPEREKLTLTDTYNYVDERGKLLFQKQRFINEAGKKTFRQRKKNDDGKWIYSLGDTPKVLYHLPEVLKAAAEGDTVWVVEGEKDAETIRRLGGVATTMPGGAGKWLDLHTEALVGAEVYIIRDNDSPGIDHALKVYEALRSRDIDVTLCMPPLEHKDVTDFIEASGDLVDLIIWQPDDIPEMVVPEAVPDDDHDSGHDLDNRSTDESMVSLLDEVITRIEDLRGKDLSSAALTGRLHSIIDRLDPNADPTLSTGRLVEWSSFIDEDVDDSYDWVVPGFLERGDRVIVVAAEGVGKTMLARQVAIATAAGVHPFTYERMPAMRTLTIDLENPERIIRRMSTSIVGAATRLSGGTGPRNNAHILIKPDGVDLLSVHDRVLIEETIERTKPDLVCLGPLYKSFVDPGTKTSEAVIVEVVKYLDYLRTTYGFVLWMEHHAPLGSSSGRELRPFGSAVWSRWPEFGLTMEPDLTADTAYTYKMGNFRGDRDVRHRPTKIKRGKVFPFEVIEFLTT